MQKHPQLQLKYLDGVWQHPKAKQIYNASEFAELHKLQVQLYAEHQRHDLKAFLQSSVRERSRERERVCGGGCLFTDCFGCLFFVFDYIFQEHYDLRRAFVVCQNCKPVPMHQEMVRQIGDLLVMCV